MSSLQQVGIVAIFDTRNFDSGVSRYQSGLRSATSATQNFNTQINNINMSQFNTSVTNTGTSLGSLGSIAGGAALAGVAALTAGVVALGAALVDSVGTAADFEQSMAGIAAVSGSAIGDIAEVKQLALDLSIDPNLKVSATEAAGAIEMLAKNGVSLENIMGGVAKSVVQMSNATGEDMAKSADVATDAMAIFGIEAENMGQVADNITGVMVNSKFGLNDFALALSQGGSVAQNAGVSLEEFSTIITATSSNFKSGSDAGTAFKTFLQRLQAPTGAARDELEKLGISVFDTEGNMKNIFDIFEQFNKALSETSEISQTATIGGRTAEQEALLKSLQNEYANLTDELWKYETGINGVRESEAKKAQTIDQMQREQAALLPQIEALNAIQGEQITTTRKLTQEEKQQALVKIFGADAIRFATAAQDISKDSLVELQKAVSEEGQAAQAAATRVQTFQGAMERLSSAVEFVKIQIGDLLLPTLTALLDKGITPLVSALPTLAGIAGAAFSRLGGMFGGFGGGLNLGFVDQIQGAMATLETTGLGGLAFDLGLGAEGINIGNQLEAAIAEGDYDKALDLLGDMLMLSLPRLQTKLGELFTTTFQNALDSVSGLNVGFLGGLTTGLVGDLLGVETTIGDVIERIKQAFSAFSAEGALGQVQQVSLLANLGLGDDAIATIVAGVENVKEVLATIPEAISEFSEGGFQGLAEYFGLPNFIPMLEELGGIMADFFEPTIINLKDSFLEFLAAFEPLIPTFGDFYNSFVEALPVLSAFAGGGVLFAAGALKLLGEVIAFVLPYLGQLIASAIEIGAIIGTSVLDSFTSLGEMFTAFQEGDMAAFLDAFTDLGNNIMSGFLAPFQTEMATTFYNYMGGVMLEGIGAITEYYEQFVAAGSELLTSIGDGIESNVTYAITKITDAMKEIYDTAFKLAADFAKVGFEAMTQIADAIWENIGLVQGALGEVIGQAIQAVLDSIGLGGTFGPSSTRTRSAGRESSQSLFDSLQRSAMPSMSPAFGARSVTNNYYLNVNNSLPGDTIRSDFELMKALA